MNKGLKNFLEKVNKFDYRAVFLTIFFLGVAIIFYVSADDTDNRYLLLVAGLVLMLTYGLYAFSFLESPNLNQIADSTYFLGFLFTLTSIAASLINLGDVNDQTITKVVSMFGFALSTTIIGLLTKILLENLKPSVSDLSDNTYNEFERTVSRFDLQLGSSADKFKSFEKLVLEQLGKHVEKITKQLDVIVEESTKKLNFHVEKSGESISNYMTESGKKFSDALNKASNEMDLPTDFFTNQIKEPLINMKDQINSFNRELTGVIKSQGTIARNTEKVSQVVEKLAVKMDLTDKMPDYVDVIEKSINEINSITDALKNTGNKINEISQSFDEVVEEEKTKLILTNEMKSQMESDLAFFQDYKRELKDTLSKSTQYMEILKKELTEAAALIVKKLG